MRRIRFICTLLTLVALSCAASAAELVIVEQPGCEWCEKWQEHVGVIYHKTDEGKVAPLRRVNIHDRLPQDLTFLRGLVYTPTFIVVDNGKEVGRILGYPGEDFFWGLLQKLLEQLPAGTKSGFYNNSVPVSVPSKLNRSG